MARSARIVTLAALLWPAFVGCSNDFVKERPDSGLPDVAEDVAADDGADEGGTADAAVDDVTAGPPKLQVDPAELRFDVEVWEVGRQTVVFQNIGASDLTLTDLRLVEETLDDAGAELSLLDGGWVGELTLAPDEVFELSVVYAPRDEGADRGYVEVRSNDPARATNGVRVPIVGEGTNQCPTAVLRARVEGDLLWDTSITTEPLKTVELRSSLSGVERYEWTIVQRPANSTTQLSPSATVAEPTLFLDVAGEYVVELKAFNDAGMLICSEQSIRITVPYAADVGVQLVWDTPDDPDQTDNSGTDMDLHLLHENGSWRTSPWDCYFSNRNPPWGATLELDDTDGAGPELITLNGPEFGVKYSVGVHYWRATIGFSGAELPSTATLTISFEGVPVFEEQRLLQNTDDFWYVADMKDGAVTPVNTLSYW